MAPPSTWTMNSGGRLNFEPLGFSGQPSMLVPCISRASDLALEAVLPGEFARRQIIESHVRPSLIVVPSPRFDLGLGIVERHEPIGIQTLVS